MSSIDGSSSIMVSSMGIVSGGGIVEWWSSGGSVSDGIIGSVEDKSKLIK